MNKISSADYHTLIRLASALPKGDDARRAILSGLKKAAVEMNDPVKVAQEILDGLHADSGAPGPTPDSKHKAKLEGLVKALLGEGFEFSTERIRTIVSPEDNEARVMLKPYKSGMKLNKLVEKIFDEG